MKKLLSISLFLVGLVFVIFSFSTNSFAVENDKSYVDGQVISASDTLDDSYLTRNDIGYKDGQIIAVSEDNTIEVFYSNFSDIQETHYNEKYGDMSLIQAVRSLNGWFATFTID